jgi:ribosomal protein L29
MKFNELTSLSDEQLVHKELGLQTALMTSLLRHRLGKLVNTGLIRDARRDIARVQTLLTQREQAAGLGKGALKAQFQSSYQPEAAAETEAAGSGFLKSLLDTSAQT